jgi:hypothetical protein
MSSTSNKLTKSSNEVSSSRSPINLPPSLLKKLLASSSSPQTPLSPNHFLSQSVSITTASTVSRIPPIMEGYFLPRTSLPLPIAQQHPISDAESNTLALPDTSSLAAADFDIDVRSGFLPPSPPITSLSDLDESTLWPGWESLLARAKEECFLPSERTPAQAEMSKLWRMEVETMALKGETDIEVLEDDLKMVRRGYLVLAFLQHYYVHSKGAEEEVIEEGKKVLFVPRSIAKPLWKICMILGLPPILTYAVSLFTQAQMIHFRSRFYRLRYSGIGNLLILYEPMKFPLSTSSRPLLPHQMTLRKISTSLRYRAS